MNHYYEPIENYQPTLCFSVFQLIGFPAPNFTVMVHHCCSGIFGRSRHQKSYIAKYLHWFSLFIVLIIQCHKQTRVKCLEDT